MKQIEFTPHKPRLLILPSPLIRSRTYSQLKDSLSSQFLVEVIQLPAKGIWSLSEHVEWLKSYLDTRGLNQVYLFGHSNSGAVAMLMGITYPQKLKGIILADTIGVRKLSAIQVFLGRLLDAGLELSFSLWALIHLLQQLLSHPINFWYNTCQPFRSDLSQYLSQLKAPTMIAWGEQDHTMPVKLANDLHRQLSSSELFIFKEGSHDWPLTHPHIFSEAVREWMKSPSIKRQSFHLQYHR
jgi:pimeloyl-ACP methyl ester carboxylesterase